MSDQVRSMCPVCSTSDWNIFFEMLDVPIFCNVLWSDRQAAIDCARGNIRLSFCHHCGFIGNSEFNPELLEYTEFYENSLDFSPRFQEYAKNLALKLINNHDLHHKAIIEIGCGKGDFLVSLCEMGDNRGVGFDPTYVPLPEHKRLGNRVQFIQDLYSEDYAHYQGDFIVCRHTLEHIQNPTALLNNLRRAIGDRSNTTIFFEVPNGLDTFHHMAIWDIIYEHCCYFTPISLSYTFTRSGFNIHNLTEEFRGQFLCIEVSPGNSLEATTNSLTDDVKKTTRDINTFATKFRSKVTTWQHELEKSLAQGHRVVVWGAGSKGVTFLNILKTQSRIDYVVDINPRKQGMYIAGTGQRIVSPEFLQDYQPDVVLIMNSIYKHEIQQTLESLGLNPELRSV
ncbi:class I SAM-dependent methyltransferase [Leptothoe spongobia]|uniref:Methyltransferase domain-containing protein n=1 Tax=Leptothoe spongobia TAU-MAC 1115 TaxID=1967444 RepID=A0A947GGN0_9CYAN|nr:methyltransferase domain-containing protein [Leptothoe spongobia TAU-MAC 1115]